MKRPLNSITARSEDDKVNRILIQIHKAINAVTSQSGLSIDSSPSSPSNESLETLRQTSALLDDLGFRNDVIVITARAQSAAGWGEPKCSDVL